MLQHGVFHSVVSGLLQDSTHSVNTQAKKGQNSSQVRGHGQAGDDDIDVLFKLLKSCKKKAGKAGIVLTETILRNHKQDPPEIQGQTEVISGIKGQSGGQGQEEDVLCDMVVPWIDHEEQVVLTNELNDICELAAFDSEPEPLENIVLQPLEGQPAGSLKGSLTKPVERTLVTGSESNTSQTVQAQSPANQILKILQRPPIHTPVDQILRPLQKTQPFRIPAMPPVVIKPQSGPIMQPRTVWPTGTISILKPAPKTIIQPQRNIIVKRVRHPFRSDVQVEKLLQNTPRVVHPIMSKPRAQGAFSNQPVVYFLDEIANEIVVESTQDETSSLAIQDTETNLIASNAPVQERKPYTNFQCQSNTYRGHIKDNKGGLVTVTVIEKGKQRVIHINRPNIVTVPQVITIPDYGNEVEIDSHNLDVATHKLNADYDRLLSLLEAANLCDNYKVAVKAEDQDYSQGSLTSSDIVASNLFQRRQLDGFAFSSEATEAIIDHIDYSQVLYEFRQPVSATVTVVSTIPETSEFIMVNEGLVGVLEADVEEAVVEVGNFGIKENEGVVLAADVEESVIEVGNINMNENDGVGLDFVLEAEVQEAVVEVGDFVEDNSQLVEESMVVLMVDSQVIQESEAIASEATLRIVNSRIIQETEAIASEATLGIVNSHVIQETEAIESEATLRIVESHLIQESEGIASESTLGIVESHLIQESEGIASEATLEMIEKIKIVNTSPSLGVQNTANETETSKTVQNEASIEKAATEAHDTYISGVVKQSEIICDTQEAGTEETKVNEIDGICSSETDVNNRNNLIKNALSNLSKLTKKTQKLFVGHKARTVIQGTAVDSSSAVYMPEIIPGTAGENEDAVLVTEFIPEVHGEKAIIFTELVPDYSDQNVMLNEFVPDGSVEGTQIPMNEFIPENVVEGDGTVLLTEFVPGEASENANPVVVMSEITGGENETLMLVTEFVSEDSDKNVCAVVDRTADDTVVMDGTCNVHDTKPIKDSEIKDNVRDTELEFVSEELDKNVCAVVDRTAHDTVVMDGTCNVHDTKPIKDSEIKDNNVRDTELKTESLEQNSSTEHVNVILAEVSGGNDNKPDSVTTDMSRETVGKSNNTQVASGFNKDNHTKYKVDYFGEMKESKRQDTTDVDDIKAGKQIGESAVNADESGDHDVSGTNQDQNLDQPNQTDLNKKQVCCIGNHDEKNVMVIKDKLGDDQVTNDDVGESGGIVKTEKVTIKIEKDDVSESEAIVKTEKVTVKIEKSIFQSKNQTDDLNESKADMKRENIIVKTEKDDVFQCENQNQDKANSGETIKPKQDSDSTAKIKVETQDTTKKPISIREKLLRLSQIHEKEINFKHVIEAKTSKTDMKTKRKKSRERSKSKDYGCEIDDPVEKCKELLPTSHSRGPDLLPATNIPSLLSLAIPRPLPSSVLRAPPVSSLELAPDEKYWYDHDDNYTWKDLDERTGSKWRKEDTSSKGNDSSHMPSILDYNPYELPVPTPKQSPFIIDYEHGKRPPYIGTEYVDEEGLCRQPAERFSRKQDSSSIDEEARDKSYYRQSDIFNKEWVLLRQRERELVDEREAFFRDRHREIMEDRNELFRRREEEFNREKNHMWERRRLLNREVGQFQQGNKQHQQGELSSCQELPPMHTRVSKRSVELEEGDIKESKQKRRVSRWEKLTDEGKGSEDGLNASCPKADPCNPLMSLPRPPTPQPPSTWTNEGSVPLQMPTTPDSLIHSEIPQSAPPWQNQAPFPLQIPAPPDCLINSQIPQPSPSWPNQGPVPLHRPPFNPRAHGNSRPPFHVIHDGLPPWRAPRPHFRPPFVGRFKYPSRPRIVGAAHNLDPISKALLNHVRHILPPGANLDLSALNKEEKPFEIQLPDDFEFAPHLPAEDVPEPPPLPPPFEPEADSEPPPLPSEPEPEVEPPPLPSEPEPESHLQPPLPSKQKPDPASVHEPQIEPPPPHSPASLEEGECSDSDSETPPQPYTKIYNNDKESFGHADRYRFESKALSSKLDEDQKKGFLTNYQTSINIQRDPRMKRVFHQRNQDFSITSPQQVTGHEHLHKKGDDYRSQLGTAQHYSDSYPNTAVGHVSAQTNQHPYTALSVMNQETQHRHHDPHTDGLTYTSAHSIPNTNLLVSTTYLPSQSEYRFSTTSSGHSFQAAPPQGAYHPTSQFGYLQQPIRSYSPVATAYSSGFMSFSGRSSQQDGSTAETASSGDDSQPSQSGSPPLQQNQQNQEENDPKLDPVSQAVYDNMMGKLPKKRKMEIPCTVCEMMFNSEVQADQHFKGVKHAKRLKMVEDMKAGIIPSEG